MNVNYAKLQNNLIVEQFQGNYLNKVEMIENTDACAHTNFNFKRQFNASNLLIIRQEIIKLLFEVNFRKNSTKTIMT